MSNCETRTEVEYLTSELKQLLEIPAAEEERKLLIKKIAELHNDNQI